MDDSCSERSSSDHEKSDQQCIQCDSCSSSQRSSDKPDEDFSRSKTSSAKKDENLPKIVKMQLKTLEDLVNVNSFFTVAVFIGLSNVSPNSSVSPKQPSLENRRRCDPDALVAKQLVMFEVLSFVFFLLSSLGAKSLKVLLNIFQMEEYDKIEVRVKFYRPLVAKLFRSRSWRRTMLLMSTIASSVGVFFLMLSMINLIQIKLGKCVTFYTSISVTLVIVLVSSALLLYLAPMIYAALATFKPEDGERIRVFHAYPQEEIYRSKIAEKSIKQMLRKVMIMIVQQLDNSMLDEDSTQPSADNDEDVFNHLLNGDSFE